MMNSRHGVMARLAMIALTASLYSQAALADNDGGCKNAKGSLSVVNNGNGTTSGAITKGGRLNGTTQAIFTSALSPTPDASTFSYTDNFSVSSNDGVLKTSNVGLFYVGVGAFTEIARIDPSTSTGRFAGATGVLYINGTTTDGGATFQAEIRGDVCLVK